MNHLDLYKRVSILLSRKLTNEYSTSFSLGIQLFHSSIQNDICSIYGFVRLADEIVDSFYHIDQREFLLEFRRDTQSALSHKFSLNPILHAFQDVVHHYGIDYAYIDAFLDSMQMDLYKKEYTKEEYEKYIYGSAEVVGLMCLKVFVSNQKDLFEGLSKSARMLGSAFQKVNFLRDFQSDLHERNRIYFPDIKDHALNDERKRSIEAEIHAEFQIALEGIKRIPAHAKFGVYLAYKYYSVLLQNISKMSASDILQTRIRIPDYQKYWILAKSYLKYRAGMI